MSRTYRNIKHLKHIRHPKTTQTIRQLVASIEELLLAGFIPTNRLRAQVNNTPTVYDDLHVKGWTKYAPKHAFVRLPRKSTWLR
jgi:hypothetical protein